MVIDGGMDLVEADLHGLVTLRGGRCAAVGAPPTAVGYAADLLDVDVDQIAGSWSFIAQRGGFEDRMTSPVNGSHSRR